MKGRKVGRKEGERLMACGLEVVVRVLCLGGLAGGGEIRLGFPDWGILDRGGTKQDGCGKRRRKDGSIID